MMFRLKQAGVLAFGGLLILLLVVMIVGLLRPEVLPEGTAMPQARLVSRTGEEVLRPDSANVTVVMFFHRRCEHCLYQLNVMRDHLEEHEARLYLVSPEKSAITSRFADNYPALTRSDRVVWAHMDPTEVKALFGPMVYPSVYIFAPDGHLTHRIRGETKYEYLAKYIQQTKTDITKGD